MEQPGDLAVDVLDRFGLALIRLKDFQELLIYVGLSREAILRRAFLSAQNLYDKGTLVRTFILLT